MEQMESPTEDFVRFFLSSVYSGLRTKAVIEQFTDIVKRALNQFMNESINQRLQSAIVTGTRTELLPDGDETDADEVEDEDVEPRIITTEEELEGFFTVKSIVREVVAPDRIVYRDTVSYMTVVLDNNKRKQICRLYFNRTTKYLSLVNEEGQHERVEIGSIDDIYNYAEQLKATAQRYDED